MRLRRPRRKTVLAAAAPVLVAGALVSAVAHPADARNAGYVARTNTPPMGFNDFTYLAHVVKSNVPTEQLFESTADAMKADGLQAAGYNYVNVDGNWQGGRTADGELFPNPTQFPHGMAALGRYLHKRGFKFGLYTAVTVSNCNAKTFGSWGHFMQDAKTFAQWGADLLKGDYCNGAQLTPDYPDAASGQAIPRAGFPEIARIQYSAMSQALAATGRSIVFSESAPTAFERDLSGQFSPSPGPDTTPDFFPVMNWVGDYGDLWRVVQDGTDSWASVLLNYQQDTAPGLAAYAGPGHWNDPDMLDVGNPGLTDTEAQSQFTLWSELAAPLLISTDVPNLSPQALSILKNKDVIAIDQDRLGKQGTVVASTPDYDVLTKPLSNGDRAVVLFNKSDTQLTIATDTTTAGFTASGHTYQLKDLVNKSTTTTTGPISATVPAHGTVIYRVSTTD